MGIFDQLLAVSRDAGIFAFYLPFLITFALLYGLLSRVGIFGRANERITNALNAIIAFSVALFVIGFTPAGITLSGFFGQFFQQSTITLITLIIGIVVLVLLGETLGPPIIAQDAQGNPRQVGRGYQFGKYVALVLVLVVVGVFINSGGLVALGFTRAGSFLPGLSGQDMIILLFIVVTGLLVFWVTGGK